jgi:hypothetical protein
VSDTILAKLLYHVDTVKRSNMLYGYITSLSMLADIILFFAMAFGSPELHF